MRICGDHSNKPGQCCGQEMKKLALDHRTWIKMIDRPIFPGFFDLLGPAPAGSCRAGLYETVGRVISSCSRLWNVIEFAIASCK